MLYHGTTVGGLKQINANSKSHTTGKPAAYFTADRCYALVCCRDRKHNFVTVGLRADGKQHYYERFPEQLKILYGGKRGYLYSPKSTESLINTNGNTWESPDDVAVYCSEELEDVYLEILKEEAKGNIIIHRYDEIDPAEQKMHANYIRAHIHDEGEEMCSFYTEHFSDLWD